MASIVDQTPNTAECAQTVFESNEKTEKDVKVPEISSIDSAILQYKVRSTPRVKCASTQSDGEFNYAANIEIKVLRDQLTYEILNLTREMVKRELKIEELTKDNWAIIARSAIESYESDFLNDIRYDSSHIPQDWKIGAIERSRLIRARKWERALNLKYCFLDSELIEKIKKTFPCENPFQKFAICLSTIHRDLCEGINNNVIDRAMGRSLTRPIILKAEQKKVLDLFLSIFAFQKPCEKKIK